MRPGTSEVTAESDRLDTSLLDFKLSGRVKRVEFEFDPPAEDGFFWGLVDADDSRPFREGEAVSFCVGGGDRDDLEWPGHFPVTFTNGALGSGLIDGTVKIDAQTSDAQCGEALASWCSPRSGDVCTAVLKKRGRIKLEIRTFSFQDGYTLCIEDPAGVRRCRQFELNAGEFNIYSDVVDLARSFPSDRAGTYRATWYHGSTDGPSIGPALEFSSSPREPRRAQIGPPRG